MVRKRKRLVKLNAPVEFRDYLYEKKAEEPSKTLQQLMSDMASNSKRKKKNGSFWGKI
jgi:uncharacterized protein YaaR (DUF327 family)